MSDCPGVKKLRAACTPQIRQADVARACGVSPQAVSCWLLGISKPEEAHMRTLKDLLGIPLRDWTAKEKG